MPVIYPPIPANIRLRPAANAGLGLFTTEALPAGHLISQIQRPLITVLDSARLTDTCEWCLRVVQGGDGSCASLKTCTGCKVVRYCSKVGDGELCCCRVPTLHGNNSSSFIMFFFSWYWNQIVSLHRVSFFLLLSSFGNLICSPCTSRYTTAVFHLLPKYFQAISTTRCPKILQNLPSACFRLTRDH